VAGLQAAPQAPQFSKLVRRFVSQPFAALLSQLPKPALQVKPQAPLVQVAAALAAAVQAWQVVPPLPQTEVEVPAWQVPLLQQPAQQVPLLLQQPVQHEPGKLVPGRVSPGHAFRLFGLAAGPHVQQRPLHMAASLVHALALVVLAPKTLAQNWAHLLFGVHLAAHATSPWPPANRLPAAVASSALNTPRREAPVARVRARSSNG
jgi:hypothetical protein